MIFIFRWVSVKVADPFFLVFNLYRPLAINRCNKKQNIFWIVKTSPNEHPGIAITAHKSSCLDSDRGIYGIGIYYGSIHINVVILLKLRLYICRRGKLQTDRLPEFSPFDYIVKADAGAKWENESVVWILRHEYESDPSFFTTLEKESLTFTQPQSEYYHIIFLLKKTNHKWT